MEGLVRDVCEKPGSCNRPYELGKADACPVWRVYIGKGRRVPARLAASVWWPEIGLRGGRMRELVFDFGLADNV